MIYNAKKKSKKCNILIFDFKKFKRETSQIIRIDPGDPNTGSRKHSVYRFFDNKDRYICEVRYGGPTANALQRGLWSHTEKGSHYFKSVTGWIDYKYNQKLVTLISHALNSTKASHKSALEIIDKNIKKRVPECVKQKRSSNK